MYVFSVRKEKEQRPDSRNIGIIEYICCGLNCSYFCNVFNSCTFSVKIIDMAMEV